MPLKILSVAFPFAPVGPRGAGGAEQILSALDQALVAAGHESIVIACAGSQAYGRLVPVPSPAILNEFTQAACRKQVQAALGAIIEREHPDLIHMHGLDFHDYSTPDDIPVIVTLHLPISWYPAGKWTALRSPFCFVCVSESQRRTCPPELRNAIVIENGVTIAPVSMPHSRSDYALALGRICPEKNAHEALEAGTRAGIPVLLAGQVFPYREHQQYFEQRIAPQLRSGMAVQHQFLGPVGPEQRNRLLSEAMCLLHPTLAPETSSLVAMESLAMGCPVIAYPSGALPEIVDHGVTGFLVENVAGMADAIHALPGLSPQACRAAAEQRFDKQRMIYKYFDLYETIKSTARTGVLHA